ncbi:UPF0158 family protein [Saccharicrinis sp. GN24d3]
MVFNKSNQLMQNYINQLVADLEAVVQNPPNAAYIEAPPHLEEEPEIAELALVPYRTIEELTGIKQEAFPEIIQLVGGQWEAVNTAIFRVFEALKIDLVDTPNDIPPEWLYEVLTTNWQHPVQYLPSSGMDLELCTGDPMTCPYGEYCDCGEDWDAYELPEKFGLQLIERVIKEIEKDCVCYLNAETLEIESVLKSPKKQKQADLKHKNWKECYVFEPFNNNEQMEIMTRFSESNEDENLSEELLCVLESKEPFANFNALINTSNQCKIWCDYYRERLKDHIRQNIYQELQKNSKPLDNDCELPF